jgi:hypothetical protein
VKVVRFKTISRVALLTLAPLLAGAAMYASIKASLPDQPSRTQLIWTYIATAIAGVAALFGAKFGDRVVQHRIQARGEASDREVTLVRQELIRRVREFWIVGLLRQVLLGVPEVELSLSWRHDLVRRPADDELCRVAPLTPRPPPKGIVEAFDASHSAMLLIGRPGSGKTVMALRLVEVLLERAEVDHRAAVPVVLNVSGWEPSETSLDVWLADSTGRSYQLPASALLNALHAGGIILVLDGIDEISARHRTEFLRSVNEFRSQVADSILICGRTAEVEQSGLRLSLLGAVEIQPLSTSAARRALEAEPSFDDAAKIGLKEILSSIDSPLLIQVVSELLRTGGLADLDTSNSDIRQELGAAYVAHLTRRSAKAAGRRREDQIKRWMAFLAREVLRRNMTLFGIRSINDGWATVRQQAVYIFLIASFVACISILLFRRLGMTMAWDSILLFGAIGVISFTVHGESAITPWMLLRPAFHRFLAWSFAGATVGAVVAYASYPFLLRTSLAKVGVGRSNDAILVWFIVLLATTIASGSFRHRLEPARLYSVPAMLLASVLNGAVVGIVVFVVLIETQIGASIYNRGAELSFIATAAIGAGIVTATVNNGAYVIYLFSLRVFLVVSGNAPALFQRFLSRATEAGLLIRVGADYQFAHLLIAEHFLRQEWPPGQASVPSKRMTRTDLMAVGSAYFSAGSARAAVQYILAAEQRKRTWRGQLALCEAYQELGDDGSALVAARNAEALAAKVGRSKGEAQREVAQRIATLTSGGTLPTGNLRE